MDQIDELNGDYLYCWVNSTRVCRGDCVAYDLIGSQDMTGHLTSCCLINKVEGSTRALVTIAKHLTNQRKVPGTDIPPPRVT
jgi:hypothetical protein